jgi:N utilization substance protein A
MSIQNKSTEILNWFTTLSQDKKISKDVISKCLEDAIKKALSKKYPDSVEKIGVDMDKTSGEMSLYINLDVVETISNPHTEIEYSKASLRNKDIKVGDVLKKTIPFNFSFFEINVIRDELTKSIRKIETAQQYELYKNRQGELIMCTVQKVDQDGLLVKIGSEVQGAIKKEHLCKTDRFNIGDTFLAVIEKVIKNPQESYIVLSRASENFVKALFIDGVPEIKEGYVEIMSIARDPGHKTKIAVFSDDIKLDPVGACIGPKGSRINEIRAKLTEEKIDIIKYDENIESFARNIFANSEVQGVQYNGDTGILEVVVLDDKKSLCIGRGGQNVRLASQLLNCDLNILSVSEKQDFIKTHFHNTVANLVSSLDIDESVAQLLAGTGYISVKQIANATTKELSGIEFFNEEVAKAVHARAEEVFKLKQEELRSEIIKLGVDPELIKSGILVEDHILPLAKAGIKSFEDFSEITVEEMQELLGQNNISKRFCRRIINFAIEKLQEKEDV